ERVRAERALRAAMQELQRLRDRLQAENVYLQEEIRNEHNFDEIVGSDPALSALLDTVTRVATSDAAVLIHGETGTGKELIARGRRLESRSGRGRTRGPLPRRSLLPPQRDPAARTAAAGTAQRHRTTGDVFHGAQRTQVGPADARHRFRDAEPLGRV